MKKSFLVIGLVAIIIPEIIINWVEAQDALAKLRKPYEVGSEEFRIPPNAIELKSIKVFPTDIESNDAYAVVIGGAQDFSQDRRGRFFIPDYRNDEILVFDKDGTFQFRFGESGQGPGEFLYPRDVFVWDDYVLIREVNSMRFQLFDTKGRYLRGFKAFKSYYSFVVNNERVFAAAAREWPQKSSDLIDVLDFDGRVINSFGKHLDVPQTGYMVLNKSRLAIDKKGHIFVAFCYFPIIRKYSTAGALLEEIRFKSVIAEKFEPLNDKMFARMFKGEQVPWGFIINAIFIDGDGLYVATAAPHRFEILLLEAGGKVSEYYYKNLERPLGCSKIIVRKNGRQKEFYVLRLYPENSVEVMIRK